MKEGDPATDEPAVTACAKAVGARTGTLREFDRAFARATVYGRRPARPGAEVVEVSERGTWTFVFSTPQRLAAHFGDCDIFATTGADLLAQLPRAIGVMLDPDDDHRMPVVDRMVPPEVLATLRRRAER